MVNGKARDAPIEGIVIVDSCAEDVPLLKLPAVRVEIDQFSRMDNFLPDGKGEALVAVDRVEDTEVSRSLVLTICHAL